ncbi:MAG TPA: hypothetical protein VNN08_15205 [Thermoanaerobaculia bacterium]|nr:hypothetical protein [Thermoanaerobaculia bacterium]
MATNKRDWVVTTSGDRPLDDVAMDLKQSGFKVAQLHHEIGLITVEGDAAAAEKARKVKGVTDVSANVGADVGPPGST